MLDLNKIMSPRRPRGRPPFSRVDKCKVTLSFRFLKAELMMSWAELEMAYSKETSALFNALPAEQRTFLRYGNSKQTPRASDDGRLAWARQRSQSFSEMYDSPLFELLEMGEDSQVLRKQFTRWLRTTVNYQKFDAPTLESMRQVLGSDQSGHGNKVLEEVIVSRNGKKFNQQVIDTFTNLQKTTQSLAIPAPYHEFEQLKKLSDVLHLDALCVILLGVKDPGSRPGIREFSLQIFEIWLGKWFSANPELENVRDIFLDTLSAQINELKSITAPLKSTFTLTPIDSR